MATIPIQSLLNREVLRSNPIATVMPDCVVIRDPARQAYTILAVANLASVKRVQITHPVLLVVAIGLALISAGAFFSKEGSGAALPLALLAGASAVAYVLTRKGSVAFTTDGEVIETPYGTVREATDTIRALQRIQTK